MRPPLPFPLPPRCSLLTVLVLALLLLPACRDDDELGGKRSDGVVEHPVADTIPHYDRNHLSIDTSRTIDELDNPPVVARTLARYLDASDAVGAQKLDVDLTTGSEFAATSVGADRLVLLDANEPRLVEHNLATGTTAEVAPQGQAPSDLLLADDMVRRGSTLYVAAPPHHIKQFDCQSSPCVFQKTARFDFTPLTLTPRKDTLGTTLIAALGETASNAPGEPLPDAEADEHPARLVDMEGTVHDAFGAAYLSENRRVLSRFMRRSMIRYVEDAHRYVIAYPNLPLLYVYDETGVLDHTYRVEDFLQPFLRTVGEPENSVRPTPDDQSNIQRMDVVEGRWILLEVNAMTDSEVDDNRVLYHERENAYYLIDLVGKESYYIGGEAFDFWEHGDRSITATEAGLVINTGGTLSLLPYDRS